MSWPTVIAVLGSVALLCFTALVAVTIVMEYRKRK